MVWFEGYGGPDLCQARRGAPARVPLAGPALQALMPVPPGPARTLLPSLGPRDRPTQQLSPAGPQLQRGSEGRDGADMQVGRGRTTSAAQGPRGRVCCQNGPGVRGAASRTGSGRWLAKPGGAGSGTWLPPMVPRGGPPVQSRAGVPGREVRHSPRAPVPKAASVQAAPCPVSKAGGSQGPVASGSQPRGAGHRRL